MFLTIMFTCNFDLEFLEYLENTMQTYVNCRATFEIKRVLFFYFVFKTIGNKRLQNNATWLCEPYMP